ncbi:MAG TPA: asparagine synthase B [Bacteriovoracaceae bacterium]|nr:asparagine synthase B [Bacteriovoracaceae bacterium]
MCGLLAYSGDTKTLPNFETTFKKLVHRGPDDTEILPVNNGEATMCFHRLAIMDPTLKGHQPFVDDENGNIAICNGEIYNYETLKRDYEPTYKFKSHSDCEVLIPMFRDLGIESLCQHLDAEFAVVIWDNKKKKLVAGRDPVGIRPLYYGYTADKKIMFASEIKVLAPFCATVEAFPPGHFYDGEKFIQYRDLSTVVHYAPKDLDKHLKDIREKLIEGVRKRLVADVPVGFLLSGGLDSSLVCGIAQNILKKPITTFAVGLDHNPIDIGYAKIVADHLKCNHHEVYFNKADTIGVLDKLIWHLETWDITTVRASIGMYLVCKYIHEKTKIKVVLTGEISDEIFGYKYTDFAPSAEAFQKEAKKRLDELHMYDVLRADRCISANSIEARVPFGDLDFVQTVMEINPELKMNTTGVGKWLLRKAFEGTKIIPDEILWREKAAFSDAVGHSMVDYLKEFAEGKYTDKEVAQAKEKYPHGTPFTKESLLYRDIFEKHFKGHSNTIKDFWMPNKEWNNCNVSDPSARVLPNYGKSGV